MAWKIIKYFFFSLEKLGIYLILGDIKWKLSIVPYLMNYRGSSHSGFVKQAIEFSCAFSIRKTEHVKSMETSMSRFTARGKSSAAVTHRPRGALSAVRLPFSTAEK